LTSCLIVDKGSDAPKLLLVILVKQVGEIISSSPCISPRGKIETYAVRQLMTNDGHNVEFSGSTGRLRINAQVVLTVRDQTPVLHGSSFSRQPNMICAYTGMTTR